MIKKLKHILFFAFIFLASACEDEVEITPFDSLDASNVFTSVADLDQGVSGLYATHDPEDVLAWSIFTDDTKIGADNGGQQVTFHNWILDSNTGQANAIWSNRYSVINTANRILEAAEAITPTEAEEIELYNRLLGECIAFRAWAHFELLQFFSEDYNGTSLGVPYVEGVNVFEEPARNTVAEVFAEIKEDITAAEGLIPASQTDNGRITLDFLTALRARLALYEGDFGTALAQANILIDKYPLATTTQYQNMFADLDETEVIFKLVKTQNDFFAGAVWYFTGTGGAFIEMSNSLFNIIEANPLDVRSTVLIDDELSDPANNLHLIGKYLGKEGFQYLNDFKIFRVSEMFLIKAEAEARNNNLTAATATLDQLRDARFGSDVPTPELSSLPIAINAILDERRLELAYEGHRYLDTKRLRDITNAGFVRDDADCGGGTPCELDVEDFRFTLPIPVQELDANSNMIQNDGY